MVLSKHKLRHGLEHRDFHRWPMPVRARASNPASIALAAAEPTIRSIAAIGMKRGWPVERCRSIGILEAAWIRSS